MEICGLKVIDLHLDSLAGIDDAPSDFNQSPQICRFAFQEGIKNVVATPHIGRYDNKKGNIFSVFQQLKSHLRQVRIDLEILSGAHIYCTSRKESGDSEDPGHSL